MRLLSMLNWLFSRHSAPRPFPRAWLEVLETIRQYQQLGPQQRIDLRRRMPRFVSEKKWLPGGSLAQVSEAMKVTIAAQACVLLLGFEEEYCFDGLGTIIVHPGPYLPIPQTSQPEVSIFDPTSPRLGESWKRGPIVLAWDHVAAAAQGDTPGLNVVVHEFSHHLDAMGYRSPTRDDVSRVNPMWSETMEAAYLRLIGQARRGELSWLNQYGATDRAEFFACACECFFELSRVMLKHDGDVYEILRSYFQQDPASWSLDSRTHDPPMFAARRNSHAPQNDRFAWRGILYYDVASDVGNNEPVKSFQDFSQLSGDAAFTLGIRYLSAGQAAEAQAAFSQAISQDTDDAEAYAMRARARSRRGRFAEALADAESALGLDANDLAALREKGAALLGMHQYDEARTYLLRASEHADADAESFFLYGVVLLKCEDWRAAAHNLTCSLVMTPLSAAALLYRSHAARMLGKRTAAEQDLLKARQLDPDIEARVSHDHR